MQQVLLKAIHAAPQLRESSLALPWLRAILRNAVTDYHRASATAKRHAEAYAKELETLGDAAPSSDEVEAEACACMHRLLPALRRDYAHVLKKVDLEAFSQEVVAKELGISTNNLMVRLHRARTALKKALETTCGICSKHGCLKCTCARSYEPTT